MPAEIRPWLLIGKYAHTRDLPLLHAHRINAMLQLAEAVPQLNILSLYLAVEDGEALPAVKLQQGVAFIRAQKAADQRILVACGAGISRSSTFALAALKEEENLTLREAYQLVKQQHPAALPHPALWQSLCSYYDEPFSLEDLLWLL